MIAMLSEDLHSQLQGVMLSGFGIESPSSSASSCEGGQDIDIQALQQTGAVSTLTSHHVLSDAVRHTQPPYGQLGEIFG